MEDNVEVHDFVNVRERAIALGYPAPTGLALLPCNFETASHRDELFHHGNAATVRALWRASDVDQTSLEWPGERLPQVVEKGLEAWVVPTIFVGTGLLTQNPQAVSLAITVIGNYLSDFFRGTFPKPMIEMDIIIERKETQFKRIHFRGPVEGLAKLPTILMRLADE